MSYATVYLIYMRFRNSYDSENDTFRIEFLLVPVIGLSFLENYAFTPLEVSTHCGRIIETYWAIHQQDGDLRKTPSYTPVCACACLL